LRVHSLLVIERRVQGIEHQNGYRITRLHSGYVGEDVWRQIGHVYLDRLRSAVLLKVVDDLRVSILRNLEVLLVKAGQRAVVLTRDHHVDNDNARTCLEDAAGAVVWLGGLATERAERHAHPPSRSTNARAEQKR
jgi:hypothetical protein